MRKRTVFSLLACLGFATCAHAVLFQDDFNDGTLDTGLWEVLAPLSDSKMYEADGNAVFFQRGILVSPEVPTALQIDGRFKFTGGDHDIFQINLRTGTEPLPPYYQFDNNIYVQFACRGGDDGDQFGQRNVYLASGWNSPPLITSFTFSSDVYYDFRIVDDGSSLSLFLGDFASPLLSVATEERTGNHFSLYNRGYVPWWPTYDNEVKLDYISVTTVPDQASSLTLSAMAIPLLLLLRFMTGRKRIES